MKKYIKPEIETLLVAPLKDIAQGGLGGWLNSYELDADTNITTFEFEYIS